MSSRKAVLSFFLVLWSISFQALATTRQFELPDNQWRQISLPLVPDPSGTNNSVREILGDDLPVDRYNTDWVLFLYDAAGQRYVTVGLDKALKRGVSYWVIQKTGTSVVLDIPAPNVADSKEIPLLTRRTEANWNMVGYPYASTGDINKVAIKTNTGSCSGANGCSVDEAVQQHLIHGIFYSYNGVAYDQTGTSQGVPNLFPWRGYWIAALADPQGLQPRIVFRAPNMEVIGPTGLKHPGCLQSAFEINALATALAKNDPYREGLWNSMMKNTRGRIDKTNWIPPTNLFGTDFASPAKYAGAGLIRYINDWIINGNTDSETAAITILNTWSRVQSWTPDPDDPLKHHRLNSMWLGYLAHAADLLISYDTSWPVEDQDAFKSMVRNVLLPIANNDRAAGFNGNWDLGATWAVMAMAVLLDDKTLFDEQIGWLQEGDTNARLTNYLFASGQNQETTRDQNHSNMGLTFLSLIAQTAWTQGVDLYEYGSRSVGKAFEYSAAYNLGENNLPVQAYPSAIGSNSAHDYNTAISEIGRPAYFDIYEMVYHHYNNYRGIELPYCRTMLENHTRPEEPGPNWSNHNSALYWNLSPHDAAAITSADMTLHINPAYAGRAFVRINCGGTSHFMASDGRVFTKERSTWGTGGSNQSHSQPINGATEEGLYQTYRKGNAQYHIALPDGRYLVTLHFAEPTFETTGQRVFDVFLEDSLVLDNLDLVQQAGSRTAYRRRELVDLDDGLLNIDMIPQIGAPVISGIEIVPYLGAETDPVRIQDNSAPRILSYDAPMQQSLSTAMSVSVHTEDADGDLLSYTWKQLFGPIAVTIDDATAAHATVHFAQPGLYTLQISVSDDIETADQQFSVTVTE